MGIWGQTSVHCFHIRNIANGYTLRLLLFFKLLSVALVQPLCLTFLDPVDCSPPGSSVHGILQARILQWVASSSSRGSSQPRG